MSIDLGRDSPGHCSCDTVSGPGPTSCLCSVGWEVLPYWSPSSNVSSIRMKVLCWFPRVWLWGAQSAPLLGATLWPGINAAVQCLSQATRWFGHTKSGWNRGRECRLVLFLWPQFGVYKAKKKKIKQQILNMTSCEVLLLHLEQVCLETAFPEGGLVGSFYLLSLTHGSHLAPTQSACTLALLDRSTGKWKAGIFWR